MIGLSQSVEGSTLAPGPLRTPTASLFLAVGTAALNVSLNQQLAGVDQLDNVDKLLEQHDRGRDGGDDPRERAVDFVGAGHLKGTRTPGAGEKIRRLGMGRVAGLGGGGLGIADGLQKRGGQHRRRKRKEVETNEAELIKSAANEQHGLDNKQSVSHSTHQIRATSSYLAVVVLVEHPVPVGVDLLVALVGPAHAQRRIHVHVVTGQVQRDQTLENDGPPGPGGAQEDQQARGGAAVRHHVQDRAESGRLVEIPRRISIQCIQQTRYAIKEGAGARVQRHVIEGCDGEDDAEVPWGPD